MESDDFQFGLRLHRNKASTFYNIQNFVNQIFIGQCFNVVPVHGGFESLMV